MVAAVELDLITVATAVERYLRNVERAVIGNSMSPATAKNYRRDLTEFVDLAGPGTVLNDLRAEDVDDIVLAFGAKPDSRYKPVPGAEPPRRGLGSQSRFRQSVSRLFTEALLEGWIESSPMPRTRVRPRQKGTNELARKALPEPSAAGLLEVAGTAPVTGRGTLVLRDLFLLRLLMECGPRVSEVCNADRADLERREDGTARLHVIGKGRKPRDLPISASTLAAYDAYLTDERPVPRPRTRRNPATGNEIVIDPVADAERALVLTWRGLRMKPRDVQLMVQRACTRLPPDLRRRVTPHGLRHTAATLLLNSGAADIHTVKEILGHASMATTGLYLDAVDRDMSEAVRSHPVTGDRSPGR